MGAKKTHVEAHSLTTAELDILFKASTDVFFFSQFIKVLHPIYGKVPFLLYPFQKAVLLNFLNNRFNIILKFRQAGVTELIAMYCLWFAMFHPHKNIIIISIKDRVAKKVLKKIKFMYKNLPDCLKVRVVNGRGADIGTATELEFSNGSMISSVPTTEDAGRGEAVSLLVIDEAAIVRWAERIWAALFPTLSTGGRAIINSTPYGVGNFFHKLFVNAMVGENPFTAIRLFWRMHPERDDEWYKMQLQILGKRKTAQEIDGDFLTSGNTVFDQADIRDIEDYLEEIEPCDILENGNLKIFELPKRGELYTLGADIATGRANDYTAFSLMDRQGDEKIAFKGKVPIDKAEKLIAKYGLMYNRARVAPESNDIGLGLATNLQNHGYPNLYYSSAMLRKKGKNKPEVKEIPGWYTTKANRPIIIDGLEEDIRNNTINLKDKFFCDEAHTFIYDSRNRPVAMNKDNDNGDELLDDTTYTDDAILAKAITNHVRKERLSNKSVLPR